MKRTSFHSVIIGIVALMIAISVCNGADSSSIKDQREKIREIEWMKEKIDETFKVSFTMMNQLMLKLKETFYRFDYEQFEPMKLRYINIRANITKFIKYAKNVDLNGCTDQWAEKLDALKMNITGKMEGCMLNELTNDVAIHENMGDYRERTMELLQQKKESVGNCELYSAGDRLWTDKCLSQISTELYKTFDDVNESIAGYIAAATDKVNNAKKSANVCLYDEGYDIFMSETERMLRSTRQCIYEKKIDFLKHNPQTLVACVDKDFVYDNEGKKEWDCVDWTLDIPLQRHIEDFPYDVSRAHEWTILTRT